MTNLNVQTETKEWFDTLQPEDATQDEFVRTLLNTYEQNEEGIDPEVWAERVGEEIAEQWANKVELGAYRGAQAAIEGDEEP